MVLAGPSTSRESVQGPWLELIYREAFRRLGYDFEFQDFPNTRASMLSDSGAVDGEINRVIEYGKLHPNMIRLGVSHFSVNYFAYAKEALPLKGGWASLKNTRYRIDLRYGNVATQQALKGLVDPSQISTVTEPAYGLTKLAAGHTDIYIDQEFVVDPVLQSAEFRDAGIRKVVLMERLDGYCYLHSKHSALVPLLTDTLAQMKKDGTIEKFRKQAFAAFYGK